eukprot:Platyproteum_vivax@DN7389_c1_g1_i1.p1
MGMLVVLINLVMGLRISSLSRYHLKSSPDESKAEPASAEPNKTQKKVLPEATAVLKATLELLDQISASEKEYEITIKKPAASTNKPEVLEMKTQLEKLETGLKEMEVKTFQMVGTLIERRRIVESLLEAKQHGKHIREELKPTKATIEMLTYIKEAQAKMEELQEKLNNSHKKKESKKTGSSNQVQLPENSEEDEEGFDALYSKWQKQRNSLLADVKKMELSNRVSKPSPELQFGYKLENAETIKADLRDYGDFQKLLEAIQSAEKSNNNAREAITAQRRGVKYRIKLIERLLEFQKEEEREKEQSNVVVEEKEKRFLELAQEKDQSVQVREAKEEILSEIAKEQKRGQERSAQVVLEKEQLLNGELEEIKQRANNTDAAKERQKCEEREKRECMQKELTKKLRELGDDEETYTKLLKEVASYDDAVFKAYKEVNEATKKRLDLEERINEIKEDLEANKLQKGTITRESEDWKQRMKDANTKIEGFTTQLNLAEPHLTTLLTKETEAKKSLEACIDESQLVKEPLAKKPMIPRLPLEEQHTKVLRKRIASNPQTVEKSKSCIIC